MSTLDALQAALAGEHACIYGYGLVGAYVSDSAEDLARDGYQIHRARRRELARQIELRHGQPVAALATYVVPTEVDDDPSARALAGLLEQRLAVLYADLIEATSVPALRELALATLIETSVLAARWTGDTVALPGIDESPEL